jgi:TDG/mug DNA glycosylase family protein
MPSEVPTILPDVLAPGLKVVFVGTAAGKESARVGGYYAGRGNRFWQTLHDIGLTPHVINPQHFMMALEYGIGLTDLAKHTAGADSSLRVQDFDTHALRWKLKRAAPWAVAFNSKRAAWEFYDSRKIEIGRQVTPLGTSAVFVLPSTSGAARSSWDIGPWQQLADWIKAREARLNAENPAPPENAE